MSIGHALIDAQHRRMVALFNDLRDALYAGGAPAEVEQMLDEMLRAAADNFATEEALMSRHPAASESFEVHREIHRGLLAEMRNLRERLFKRGAHIDARTINFIRQWLLDHILHSDRELAGLA